MDKVSVSVATFDKLAQKYQDKYMAFDFYCDTYDSFCDLVTSPNAAIFEIGCGPGNISRYLLNKRPDFDLYGIDLAPNMVALARANNPEARFEVMDCRDINCVQRQFDAILCGFCLPYIDKADVARLIGDARALLKTGGLLYLSTMEDDDARSGLQTSSSGDSVYIHYHQFDFIAPELKRQGFEILKTQRKAFPVEQGEGVTDLFLYARAC